MRLRGIRFTVRRMMVAVAIVGGILAAWIELRRLRVEYTVRGALHAMKANIYTYGEWPHSRVIFEPRRPPPAPDARKVAYYDAMAQKWWNAAERPWLPVEPDPPDPE
jgi:hypothetical protein